MRGIGRTDVIATIKLGLVAMLLYALNPSNGHDYYLLLRIFCFGFFGFLAYEAAKSGKSGWVWTFATIALLYNPFAPVGLRRHTWEIINVATALLLAFTVCRRWIFRPRALLYVGLGVLTTACLAGIGYLAWTRENVAPQSSSLATTVEVATASMTMTSCRAIRATFTDARGTLVNHVAAYAVTYDDGRRVYISRAPIGITCN